MMINKRLIGLCEESKKYIGLTVLVNWVSIICNISVVLLIGGIIDVIYLNRGMFVENGDIFMTMASLKITKSISFPLAIMMILSLLLIRYISNILYGKFSYLASSNARVTLRALIYKKLLKIGATYNNVESTSSIVQVAVEGIEALEVYFGRYLPQFFYAMLAPLTLFVVLSFISIKVSLVFIICVPLIPLSIIAIMKVAKKILKNYWESYSNLGDTFLENLQGLTTLKVFDMDKDRHEKMNGEAERFRKITMKVLSMQLNSINVMDLIAFGGAALGTIVALLEFRNGNVTIGGLLVIILLSSEFFIPLRLLGSFFHIAMNGMAASDRIFELLDSEEREKTIVSMKQEKLRDVCVQLKDVNFTYDGEREVLKDINMNITSKGLTAIVGESGSGKSTIASLILNTYEVSRGEIEINGVNIDNIESEKIYEKVSLVSTNSYIFNGSILDNLLMGNPKASNEEIYDALKIARLYEFVRTLEDGLNTKVGENGSLLSGGQKQRLALARAVLGNRGMIIFDEATSNIDMESEEDIWKAIYELSQDRTILVISHRLSNVKEANKIYVMKHGEIIESGLHSELYNNKYEYYNMVKKQSQLESIGMEVQ